MHTKPMSESEGAFKEPEPERFTCRKCQQQTATCRTWESSCGGYEDYKYECQDPMCKHVWWVDGIDS